MRCQAEFVVIRETGLTELEPVKGSGRVVCLRHRDAGSEWAEHILACHPYVVRFVPLDDDVAIVVNLADAAEASPELIAGKRTSDQVSGGFVVNGIADVHPLNDLGIADRKVRVGRRQLSADDVRAILSGRSTRIN